MRAGRGWQHQESREHRICQAGDHRYERNAGSNDGRKSSGQRTKHMKSFPETRRMQKSICKKGIKDLRKDVCSRLHLNLDLSDPKGHVHPTGKDGRDSGQMKRRREQ